MGDPMADSQLEERLARIEADLATPKTPLENRLTALESRVDALKPKTKDFWDKAQSLSGLTAALVTGIVGFYLTGVVNKGFEERKLETANVEKMRELIVQLIEDTEAEAIGLTLGAFGEFAVPSLIAALGTNTSSRAAGARAGLLAASLNDKVAVCRALGSGLAYRSQRYTVLRHARVVGLLGRIDCGAAADETMRAYLKSVVNATQPGGLSAYAQTLDPVMPVGPDEVGQMLRTLCATPQLRADCAQRSQ
jgi:hypothetical protein